MLLGSTKVGLGPGYIVLDGAQLPPEGAQASNFRPISIVAKWSPISTTGERLLYMIQYIMPSIVISPVD